MPQISQSKINQIFSASDVKHGLSLFTNKEIEAVEAMIIERDGRFHIKCQIKDRYKAAKPEEIVRQLWVYRLLNEYNYPKEIKEFIIPILPLSIQQKIASLVQQSHEARRKAKELLEEAKKTVEIAIENR